MNIQSIFYKHKPGGLSKRLVMLCTALAARGHHIHHIGARRIPAARSGITQHLLTLPGADKENLLFWLGFTAAACIKTFTVAARYDVRRIFTFSPFYTLLAAVPILIRRIPAATFIRADNQRHSRNVLRNCFFYWVDWAGIRLSRQILFVSHGLKDIYRKRYRLRESKLHVLPNHIAGIHRSRSSEKQRRRRLLGVDTADFLVVTAGNLQPSKNFGCLIEAVALCDHPRIKLLIMGAETRSSGEMQRLKRLADKLGVGRRVIFSGWLMDPQPYLAASDLFVFPSRHEGSPNSLLEALACDIPCMGSSIPEIREVLEHDELLFPPDDPRMLCERIFAAATRPRRYARLQQLCRKQCQKFRFDWVGTFSKIIGLDSAPDRVSATSPPKSRRCVDSPPH